MPPPLLFLVNQKKNMASKFNNEFNYRYQVEGNTPWARIKTLEGFLEGRVRAGKLEQVAEIKYQAKLAEIEHLKDVGAAKYLVMLAQAELIEIESSKVIEKEAFDLNRQEIVILNKVLTEELAIAEPTRLKHGDGTPYTNEEMYEANAANEFTVWVAREIHAELLAVGRPSPAKIRNAMLYPGAFDALQKIGLLPLEANIIVNNSLDITKLELDAVRPLKLISQNTFDAGPINIPHE